MDNLGLTVPAELLEGLKDLLGLMGPGDELRAQVEGARIVRFCVRENPGALYPHARARDGYFGVHQVRVLPKSDEIADVTAQAEAPGDPAACDDLDPEPSYFVLDRTITDAAAAFFAAIPPGAEVWARADGGSITELRCRVSCRPPAVETAVARDEDADCPMLGTDAWRAEIAFRLRGLAADRRAIDAGYLRAYRQLMAVATALDRIAVGVERGDAFDVPRVLGILAKPDVLFADQALTYLDSLWVRDDRARAADSGTVQP